MEAAAPCVLLTPAASYTAWHSSRARGLAPVGRARPPLRTNYSGHAARRNTHDASVLIGGQYRLHDQSSARAGAALRAQAQAGSYNGAADVGGDAARGSGWEEKQIKEIVVVGGGTAGWMAASYLGKALDGTARITVLESPEIATLGVGEATVPNLHRVFFDYLGIPESEWMREVNASYKMGVKYINWRTPGEPSPSPRPIPNQNQSTMPGGSSSSSCNSTDYFYHLFCALRYHDQLPLSHYWFWDQYTGAGDKGTDQQLPYAYTCYDDAPAMDLKKAPCWMDGTPAAVYAWHFDAHLVADFLRRHATSKLGVQHVQDRMVRVEMVPGSSDRIRALHTASGRVLEADLFIDCTGFRGLLINEALDEPFLRTRDLLCDSAVATQVPHDDDRHGIEPYTSSIGMDAGWTWKIPLLGRFGTGYVYSSQFATQDEAARDFCKLWGLDPDNTRLNKIRFRVGRNRRAWVGNCVAIGAASCFLEPLESTGIYFVYAALYQLVQHFPDKDFRPGLVERYNQGIEAMFEDTRNFMLVHYAFTPRRDTPFWRACAEMPLSERAQEMVSQYLSGLILNPGRPHRTANTLDYEFRHYWTNSNFYCVLAGMGLLPETPLPRLRHMPESVRSVSRVFEDVKKRQQELVRTLPSCHEYLAKLHGRDSSCTPAAADQAGTTVP